MRTSVESRSTSALPAEGDSPGYEADAARQDRSCQEPSRPARNREGRASTEWRTAAPMVGHVGLGTGTLDQRTVFVAPHSGLQKDDAVHRKRWGD